MRRQSFYQLPRVTQDRFIAATRGQTVPSPLVTDLVKPGRGPVIYASGALLAVLCLFGVLRLGYGDLQHDLAIAPLFMAGIYFCLIVALGIAAHCAYWDARAQREMPYLRGRFVFPSGLIDSSEATFRILPISDLARVEVTAGNSVCLTFSGNALEQFTLTDPASAQAACEDILAAKAEYLEKQARGAELTLLDPLLEPRFSSPLSSRQALKRSNGLGLRLVLPLLLLLAVPSAFGLLKLRNTLSERRLFSRAVAENSVTGYQAYLKKSDKHAEVASVLLPRAQLAQLASAANLEALESFLRENQDSPVRPEIEAQLRQRLLAALAVARAENTLTALSAFTTAHPTSSRLIQNELLAARKSVLADALERFVPRASATPGLVAFMQATLAEVALHGPAFEVRFQRVIPPSAIRADEMVRNSEEFHPEHVPSQYFDEPHAEASLERLFQQVFHGFGRAFPTDTLDVKRGEWLPQNIELQKNAARPSLLISYSSNMGAGIRNRNPSGVFFGVGVQLKARLVHPSAEPLELRYALWTPPDLLRLRQGKITPAEVYQAMLDAAFKGFERKLTAWLFKRDLGANSAETPVN